MEGSDSVSSECLAALGGLWSPRSLEEPSSVASTPSTLSPPVFSLPPTALRRASELVTLPPNDMVVEVTMPQPLALGDLMRAVADKRWVLPTCHFAWCIRCTSAGKGSR